MQNVTELRGSLIAAYQGIQDGTMPITKAKEIANVAGKIIATLKCQLVYAALRKETPEIEFLGTPKLIEAEETAK